MKFQWSEKDYPLTYKDIKITDSEPIVTNPDMIKEFENRLPWINYGNVGIVKNLALIIPDEYEFLTESEFNSAESPWLFCGCVARVETPLCEEWENGTWHEYTEEEHVGQSVCLSWNEFQLVNQAGTFCCLTRRITDTIAKSFYNTTNTN